MHVRLIWKMTKGNTFITFEMVEELTLYAHSHQSWLETYHHFWSGYKVMLEMT
jgi:hypothetical protein